MTTIQTSVSIDGGPFVDVSKVAVRHVIADEGSAAGTQVTFQGTEYAQVEFTDNGLVVGDTLVNLIEQWERYAE